MKRFHQFFNFSLSYKLSVIVIIFVIVSQLLHAWYFDRFLEQNHFTHTKERMQYTLNRLHASIQNTQQELTKAVNFIQTDEEMIASIELINNYEDVGNYNSTLIDEEKKLLLEELLYRVKLSLNNDVSLYNHEGKLIGFILKTGNIYQMYYISFVDNEQTLFSKFEGDKNYRKTPYQDMALIPLKHEMLYKAKEVHDKTLTTFHSYHDELYLKAHKDIIDPQNKKVVAHVEMTHKLGAKYLEKLSNNLNTSIYITKDAKFFDNAQNIQDEKLLENFTLLQSKENYSSVNYFETNEAKLYLKIDFNRSELKNALNEKRKELILLLALLVISVPLILSVLFKKILAEPLSGLIAQIKKIENGDYSPTKLINTNDELEHISQNVNHLAYTVEQRELELERSKKNLEYLSNHDSLTNMPNRRHFLLALDHSIELAKRKSSKLAVVFIDLDQFKEINDTLGHDIGDQLLIEVSKRLTSSIRTSDTLARIGGDEFNILLESVKHAYDIELILRKVLDSFQYPFECSNHMIHTTVSMGVAIYPEDGEDSTTLLKNADLAMYRTKDTGRNNFNFFSSEMSEYIHERSNLIDALKYAIDNSFDEFTLYYQPKMCVHTNKIIAIEALLRWNSSKLGFVSPDKFITIAEETNLIIPLGEWVLEQACRDFVKLQKNGMDLNHISINISAVQLQNSDMFNTLIRTINKTKINPQNIELEITESYIATNEIKAMQILERFRQMKIGLAIDDFGTGYSSMSYLQKLPVTRLKIDKSFVDNIDQRSGSAIVKAIIALAKTFELSLTAEGVETQEQAEFLIQEKCDELQGYFYARPLPFDDLVTFCQKP